jgi:hypothetical protein
MFYKAPNQYITEGNAFEINGTQYPANWLNLSTPEEKAALGLEEVTDANAPEDDRFYWVSSELNGAVRTYTNTPKELAGLKAQWVTTTNAAAYSLLLPTDWMVTKAFETQTPIPVNWSAWRAAVRTTAANTVTAINAATDVPSLQAAIVVDWPHDPNYVAA